MKTTTKTTAQLNALQIKAQALSQTLNKEVVTAGKGKQHIQVKSGSVYELTVKNDGVLNKDFDIIAKKVGDDLEVLLVDDVVIVFDDYFEVCASDLSCLVSLPAEDGVYYVVESNFVTLADGSQIVYFYGDESALTSIASSQSALFSQSFNEVYLVGGFSWSSVGGALAAVGIAGSSSGAGAGAGSIFSLEGSFSTGKFSGASDVANAVFIYDKEGNQIANVDLKADGTYAVSKADLGVGYENYTGTIYIRLSAANNNILFKDEATNAEATLKNDLYSVATLTSGSNIAHISVQTTIVAQVVVSGTKFTIDSNGKLIISTDGSFANIDAEKIVRLEAVVRKALGLDSDILTTRIDTINSEGDEQGNVKAGQVAASLSGAVATAGDFQAIIEDIVKDIDSGGILTTVTADKLTAGAAKVKTKMMADANTAVTNATNAEAIAKNAVPDIDDANYASKKQAYDDATAAKEKAIAEQETISATTDALVRDVTFIKSPITSAGFTLSADTGSTVDGIADDFITKTETQDVTTELGSALGTDEQVWLSVNKGVWVKGAVTGNTNVTWAAVDLGDEGINGIRIVVSKTGDAAQVDANKTSAIASKEYTLDITPPTVTIKDDAIDTVKKGEVITYTFTFNEDVTNFTEQDVVVTNGVKSTWTKITNKSYTLVVTPTDEFEGDVTVALAANKVTDIAGNNNIAIQSVQTVDMKLPTITISSDTNSLIAKQTADITFTFSETPTGFTNADVTLTNGTLSDVTVDSSNSKIYTAIFTPKSDSTVNTSISIDVSKFTDIAGNANAVASNTVSMTVDTVVPFITDISATTDNGSFKVDDTIDLVVTVSEDMSENSQIIVTLETGLVDKELIFTRDATNANQFKATYTVTTAQASNDLSVIKVAAATDSGKEPLDIAGNAFASSTDIALPAGKNLNDNNNLVIDTFAPDATLTEATIQSTGAAHIKSSETGVAYLVHSSVSISGNITKADFDTLSNGNKVNKTSVTANVETDLAATGLIEGVYKLYTIDIVGNVSSASSLLLTIDNTAPVFGGLTTADAIVNADSSVVVYDAQATDDSNGIVNDTGIIYSVKNATNSKFEFKDAAAAALGKLTYKTIQTSKGVDSVTIIATDVAGNSTEQTVQITLVEAPSLIISSDKPNGTNNTFTLTFTFSEAVTGFEINDIVFGGTGVNDVNITKGTLTTATSGDTQNKVFTLLITPKTELTSGNITVDVAANSVNSTTSNQSNIAAVQFRQVFDETAPDTPDLDATNSDLDPTDSIMVNRTQMATGVEFVEDFAAPSATDIAQIVITISNAHTGDQLVLETEQSLSGNFSGTDKTIGGISGVDYNYVASSDVLTISKNTGGVFSGVNIKAIIDAIKLKNNESGSIDGVRTIAIKYVDSAENAGNSATITMSVDSTRLSASSFSGDISSNKDLTITFSDTVQKGTGTIAIYESGNDGTPAATIDVATSKVTINDKVISIEMPSGLALGKEYYVKIDDGAFTDLAGNGFGISDKTTWQFNALSNSNQNTALGALSNATTQGVPALSSGEYWDLSSDRDITYSFNESIPSASAYNLSAAEISSWKAFNNEQKIAARSIFTEIGRLLNITFSEVADTAADSDGDLQFNIIELDDGFAGYAYYPGSSVISGDVFLTTGYNTEPNTFGLEVGEQGHSVIVHEIGHALGLKHPFESSPILPPATDDTYHTVMSYTSRGDVVPVFSISSGSLSVQSQSYYEYPTLYSLYDVAALQAAYGVNTNTNAGNTTYTYEFTDYIVQTIWDAGGTDLIDLSACIGNSVIDLNPGSLNSVDQYTTEQIISLHQGLVNDVFYNNFISQSINQLNDENELYKGKNNLGIATGAIIENINTGSGDDIITDNIVDNIINAGSGDDKIYCGNGGFDTVAGGAGFDELCIEISASSVVLKDYVSGYSLLATDNWSIQFKEIERLVFDDQTVFLDYTNNADTIAGTTGADKIFGGAGNDTITGGAGNDELVGDAGADILTGGNGIDIFNYNVITDSNGANIDTIKDFAVGIDKIDLQDLLTGTPSIAANIYVEVVDTNTLNVRVDVDGTGTTAGTASTFTDSIIKLEIANHGYANDVTALAALTNSLILV